MASIISLLKECAAPFGRSILAMLLLLLVDPNHIIVWPLLATARRSFLHLHCYSNQLRGVGGPGAPHVFAFDRFDDLGLPREQINSSFWQKLGFQPHGSDVVMRIVVNK